MNASEMKKGNRYEIHSTLGNVYDAVFDSIRESSIIVVKANIVMEGKKSDKAYKGAIMQVDQVTSVFPIVENLFYEIY